MKPVAIVAAEAPPKAKQTNYPQPFAARVAGRLKRPLGDLFGLTNFGVNLTRLAPGAISALRHSHSKQVFSSSDRFQAWRSSEGLFSTTSM